MSPPPFARSSRLARFPLQAAALAAFFVALPVFGERLVTVRATADDLYARKRAVTNPPKVETYVFAKGEYFPGVTYDATMNKMAFDTIAQTLAFDLQRQNYLPAPSLAAADLLLVVHWGVTMPNDRGGGLLAFDLDALRQASDGIDATRQAVADDTSGSLDAIGVMAAAQSLFRNEAQNAAMTYQGDDLRAETNAELLGFKSALNAEQDNLFGSEKSRMLRSMIDEERYFIVVIAYEAAKFRAGKKQKLWISRLSIRSAGVNFKIALDRMSNAGAKFHGTRQPELALEFLKDRTGTVKIGDFKVIDDSRESPEPKETK